MCLAVVCVEDGFSQIQSQIIHNYYKCVKTDLPDD